MLRYRGLARISSRVRRSGAWRRMRSSHDSFMSSMAAHSSPRGRTPAARKASSGTRCSWLPRPSSPRASASRRAGSTVSTRTLPPWRTAAMHGGGGGRRRLAHPAGSAADDDLLGRQQPVEAGPPVGSPATGTVSGRPSVPELLAQRGGHLSGGAQAVGAGEEVGQIEHGHRVVDAGPQVFEMGRARRGASSPPAGRLRAPARRPRRAGCRGCDRTPGAPRASKTRSSWRPKSSGRTRLTTTAESSTVVSSRTRSASSIVSVTGISSGVHTTTSPVVCGSDSRSTIQSVCERMSPTLTRLLMAWGADSRPMMCPDAGASTTTKS